MDKLLKERFVTKAAGESYVINKKKVPSLFLWNFSPYAFHLYPVFVKSCSPCGLQSFDYEFDAVKEEADVQVVVEDGKAGTIDHMYMKVNFIIHVVFHNT